MLQNEIKTKTISFITAAFGLVAGLAWNDAIKAFIEYFFPIEQNTLIVKFVYAATLTVVLVIVTVYLSRIFRSNEEETPTQ